jgi:hypothetical protein
LLSRRFILGHEIGHALIYYSRNQCKEMLYLARENALSIMKILSEVGFTYAPRSGKRNRRKVLSSWSEEFAADAIGLGLAIEAAEDARIQHLTVLAVEETLTTIALAEFFWPVTQLGMKPYICHHPFGIVRSKNLRRCFAPNCPESVLNVGPEFFDHLFWDQVKSWWH